MATLDASRSRHRAAIAALFLSLALVACTSSASPPAAAIGVEDAWARPSMGMDRAGAVYLVLVNETATADRLVSATSPAAGTVELHETAAGASGMMAMHPVHGIDIAAGERVALEPGGFHVMLIGLTQPLTAGDTVELTLTFEHSPSVTVSAPVRAS
jgi:copper(I)-binding protein